MFATRLAVIFFFYLSKKKIIFYEKKILPVNNSVPDDLDQLELIPLDQILQDFLEHSWNFGQTVHLFFATVIMINLQITKATGTEIGFSMGFLRFDYLTALNIFREISTSWWIFFCKDQNELLPRSLFDR